jgi:hypothetical protein
MGKFFLRDAEVKKTRTRKELDIFPGDELIGKDIGEKPAKGLIYYLLPSDPSHQATKSDIHMNQPETRIHPKKMEVVNPHHLCAKGIDNLFIHHFFSEKDDIFFWKGRLEVQELFLRESELGLQLNKLLPGKIPVSSPYSDHHPDDHWIRFCSLGH